ncbi:Hypothetical_protein [Hexamita inflata]|uniref:Hypothetical_protein n=1 Tax=Hexamita inflata TaxID=28002 RepID=A0AA86QUZ8_9EUKA|nr:Hypothetical protein HINF_LOCUS51312 [Hexamita inflata]
MAPRQAAACQRDQWCISSFLSSTLNKMVRSAQLARVETPQRTVLAPYLISPDGRSGRFLQKNKLLNQSGAGTVYFECLQHGTANWLSSSAFQVSLQTDVKCAAFSPGTKTAAHFKAGSILSIQTDFGSIFGKRRGCLPGAARVYFAGLVFIIHTTALSTNLHFQKKRDRPFSVSVYKPTLCSCSTPLNKQSRCLTKFAIGHKLQSFQFRSINLLAAQMEEPQLKKRKNATDQSVLETPRKL